MDNTTGVASAPRAQLWREGLVLFRSNWQEWSKWAVWFFLIMAILQAVIYDPTSQETLDKLNKLHPDNKGYTPDETATMMHAIMHMLVGAVPTIILAGVQTFAYIVFFMKRQQPVIGTPVLSVGRFFYWVWNNILMFLLFFLAGGVCAGVPAGIGAVLIKNQSIYAPAAFILFTIGLVYVVFISLRLTLVPTLAACAMKPVFKTSWRLTQGNCWRLFGNSLLLLLIVMLFWIIAMIVERAASEIIFSAMRSFSPEPPPAAAAAASQLPAFMRFLTPAMGAGHGAIGQYIQIAFDTLNLCVLSGLLRAFYCAATRVLEEERHIIGAPSAPAA